MGGAQAAGTADCSGRPAAGSVGTMGCASPTAAIQPQGHQEAPGHPQTKVRTPFLTGRLSQAPLFARDQI